MKIKSYIYIIAAALLFVGCNKINSLSGLATPSEVSVDMQCVMSDMLDNSLYAGQTIKLIGATESYEVVVDADGKASAEGVIPGLYDISTSWGMTAQEYNALIGSDVINENLSVVVAASMSQAKVFSDLDLTVNLMASSLNPLIISKVYYSGTKSNMDTSYTQDSYIELFNNSDAVTYLDGLYMGLTEAANPAWFLASENLGYVYAKAIVKFPGSGIEYPVQPGESIVIATRSAINHTTLCPITVDLTDADFEVKLIEGSKNPDVPALSLTFTSLTSINTYLNMLNGGLSSVFLMKVTDEEYDSFEWFYRPGYTTGEINLRIPEGAIVDGVECLKNWVTGLRYEDKRLQDSIDVGATWITSATGYTTETVERKVDRVENGRVYLKDTNNSTFDFVTIMDNPTHRDYTKEELY